MKLDKENHEKNPQEKMKVLKDSFESGLIGKEEYERSLREIEPEIKEYEKRIEEKKTQEIDISQKSSDKSIIIAISVIIVLLAAVLVYSMFAKQEPKTLEDLHVANIKGDLKPEQGYVYKGVYSFVNLDGLWYTQLKSPRGTKTYEMALRYSPNDVEEIDIEGSLNANLFNNATEYYVTFNPTGQEFSHIALAVADFNTHMAKVFGKNPVAACDRNETDACKTRPVVTCNSDKIVLYVKEAEKTRAYYNSNCIVVEGMGLDLVKGVDRVLYNLYGMMEQKEQ